MSFYPENFCNEFNSFIVSLNNIFPQNELLIKIHNETAEEKIIRVQRLYKSLSATTNFNNFCKSKIKVFSHKENDTHLISESLFGSQLSLKKIFNNQTDDIKEKLWNILHNLLKIYLEQEKFNNPSKLLDERLVKLQETISNTKLKLNQTKQSLKNLLQTDKLNGSTNEMINDIFKSFEEVMTGKNDMNSIINLSTQLGEKYEDKIKNGEIDFNGLLGNLQNTLPGMENMKNIIDPLMQMTSLGKEAEPTEKVIIDENFSTASVQTGKLDEMNEKPMLGNMINVVNKSGLIDMMSGNGNGPNLMNMFNGNPSELMNMFSGEGSDTINKLLGVANKLKETGLDNREEINNIFKNDLGLDVDKINAEMASLMQNCEK